MSDEGRAQLRAISVRGRLLLGLGCILLPLLIAWASTGFLLHQTLVHFRAISKEAVVESKAVAGLRKEVDEAEGALEELLQAAPSPEARSRFAREASRIDSAFAGVDVDTGPERELLASAQMNWEAARGEAATALRRGEAEPEGFYDLIDTSTADLENLQGVAFEELEGQIGEAERLEDAQLALALALSLVTVALALLVARWLSGSILRPVARLKRGAASLRLDDLSVRVRAERPDELGQVAEAFNDMAERLARNRDELQHQAFHDSLTGLANRALLLDRTEHARGRASRSNAPLAVLALDVDDFKSINDTLGHGAGDELLKTVAERLRSSLRPQDTPARLGGDEFAILLEDLQEPAEAIWVAERVLAALSEPYRTLAGERRSTVSIGIALGVAGAESGDELIRNADLALYRAKQEGKNRVETFRPQMYQAALERQALEADLRQALEREELVLQYQPLVELDSTRPYGFEALVRWRHPERGLVQPDVFIPIAEATGLIIPLGRWVLEHACSEAVAWPTADGEAPIISVNLSARQLADADLPAIVAAALASSGLAPSRLLLEITESALAHDNELALERLLALKALGVSLAVDDFGTGYSSLSRLRTLPVDIVKIDKSFIDGVATSDSAFVLAILRLAEDVNLVTIAEGVEQPEQSEALLRLGCTKAQGYLFARPLDASAVAPFLLDREDAPAALGAVVAAAGRANR